MAEEAKVAVAVTTYSNLFNVNPVIRDADLLIFDDAHGGRNKFRYSGISPSFAGALSYWKYWRRGSGSNRRVKVLQTSPLPLGYRALAGLLFASFAPDRSSQTG